MPASAKVRGNMDDEDCAPADDDDEDGPTDPAVGVDEGIEGWF